MELTIVKSDNMDDWYLIERAEHDGRMWTDDDGLQCSSRFSDADVEGCGVEMLAIAAAIRTRSPASFRRCAVIFLGNCALFRSPRNSRNDGECTIEEADRLADKIEAMLGGK